MPRFDDVTCSQCGQSFGPGDHGFSHCSDHAPKVVNYVAARAAWTKLHNLSGNILFDKIAPEEISRVTEDAARHLVSFLSLPPEVVMMLATTQLLKDRIDYRLNDYLCEMKPNYDDSITGFNEAWDIMREIFKETFANAASNTGRAA